MAPRKSSPSPATPGSGPINRHGTRPEMEAVLKMRENQLEEFRAEQKRLTAKGLSDWGLDCQILNLTIMVKNLREELSSIK